jgi:predicted dehydrogenase
VRVFPSVDALLASGERIDLASLAVPTSLHAEVGVRLLNAGWNLLVEKPLAASLTEADALIAAARDKGLVLQPGHLERFNPAVMAVEPMVRSPRFFEVHRLSVFSPRALDVDVVLDLMIHDLDIVLRLAESPVRELRAVGIPILSRKVDIANVRLEFESGCVANLTASRVSTERVRKLRFFQLSEYISLDYARRDLLRIGLNPAAAANLSAMDAAKLDAANLPPGLHLEKPVIAAGEPLRLEIESFIAAVRNGTRPHVSAEEGRAALALALEIHRTMAEHAVRAGLA